MIPLTRYSLSCSIGLGLASCFSPNVPVRVDDSGEVASTGSASDGAASDSAGPATSDPIGTDADVTVGSDPSAGTEAGDATQGTDPSESSSGSTGAAAGCGDGALDEGEACDDGDDINGNGCNVDCVVSGSLLWEVDAGAGYEVEASDPVYGPERVAVSPSGSIAMVLTSSDEPDRPAPLVRRYDPEGNLEWSEQWTLPNAGLIPADVVVASDDAVVAVSIEVNGPGGNAGHVRRYGALGTEAWSLAIADADQVVPGGVASAELGEVLVAGYTFGPNTQWARRYSPAGRELLHDSGPRGSVYVNSIRLVEDGGYLVCSGRTLDGGGGGASIARYTANGTEDWVVAIPEIDLVSCDADASGRIAIAGDASGASWVARAQGEAVLDWSVLEEGTGGAEANAVALDGDGNVIVAGTLFESDGADSNAVRWLRKFDAAGALLWEAQLDFSSEEPERVADVTVDGEGYIYTVGRRDDVGGRRAWLAKFAP